MDIFFLSSLKLIEHNELTPVNPLKFRFTVLPKLFKKMTLYTEFIDMKQKFVSYPVFKCNLFRIYFNFPDSKNTKI